MNNNNLKNLELLRNLVGVKIFKQIVLLHGGSNIYIPTRDEFNKEERNAEIRQKFFGGASLEQIALEYDLSESHTRTIINNQIKRR